VPKALTVLGVLLMILPWALQIVMDYTTGVIGLMGRINR
jgi:flagellar biosynthesis protein FliQ